MRRIFAGALFVLPLVFTSACGTDKSHATANASPITYAVREAKFQGENLDVTIVDGRYFWFNVRSVHVAVRGELDGTYVQTVASWDKCCGYSQDDVVILVKTEAQAAEWNRRLAEVRDEYYKPRDVLPVP